MRRIHFPSLSGRWPLLLAFLLLFSVFLRPGALVGSVGGSGAAPIDESQISVTLHVSPTGNDSNSGSASFPFRTITRGLNATSSHNTAGRGVRVLVQPGTYREGTPGGNWAILFPSPSTAAPVVLEGAGWNHSAPTNTGDVIISGSEVWTGWTDAGNGTWTRHWPYTWGASPLNGSNPPAAEAFRRYEMVHVDGQTYYQVSGPNDTAALSKLTASEGAFWVDEATQLITIRPPAGLGDLNARLVEVTTKRRLLYHFRGSTATGDTNIIIRNFVFQHAAPGLMQSAVHLQNIRNAIVEDVVVRNNKHTGLNMDARAPYTVRRVAAIHNGEAGAGGRGRGALWEDSDFSYNARQAHISGYYSWSVNGIKLGDAQNTTIRRSRASHNAGFGFWWDTGCFRSELADSVATHNFASGTFVEFNNNLNPETPALGSDISVLTRNSVFAHNRRPPVGTYMGRGFLMSENENAVFDHCVFFDNDQQIGILDNTRGPQRRTVISRSVIAATLSSQLLYGNAGGNTMWRQFFDHLDVATNDNFYQHPNAVSFPNRDHVINQSLAGWQALHLANPNNASADKAVDSRSSFAASGFSGEAMVGIETPDAFIPEQGGSGSFIFTRAAIDVFAPLTVHFTVATGPGYATPGEDYPEIGTSITIPAGQHRATLVIAPFSDGLAEGNETVLLDLAASPNYFISQNSASFVIVDTEAPTLPEVSIEATEPFAREENQQPGRFTLARTGSLADPLVVDYEVSGTATSGADFQELTGSATFPAGAASVEIIVIPVDDDLAEEDESVILTLITGPGYSVGSPASATVTILDNDRTAPAITSPLEATATVGLPFSYQIVATNGPRQFGAANLPAGLSVNAATGLISGTPSAAGTRAVTLSASHDGGSGNATLQLHVAAAPRSDGSGLIDVFFREGVSGYAHTGATIRSAQPTTNAGSNSQIIVGMVNGNDRMRGVLSFPLSAIPTVAEIVSVTLEMQSDSQAGAGTLTEVQLRNLTATPAENFVTWLQRAFEAPWTTPGGDLGSTLSSVGPVNGSATNFAQTFLSSAAFLAATTAAVSGSRPLDLILLAPGAELQTANQFVRFASDNHTTLSARPRLNITYRMPEQELSPFSQWLADFGLPDDTATTADLNGDGNSLLLAYALGLDPRVSSPSPVAFEISGSQLQITFLRARPELDYELLASSDLQTWSVIATNPGTVGHVVTASEPATDQRRFLRLRVTSP